MRGHRPPSCLRGCKMGNTSPSWGATRMASWHAVSPPPLTRRRLLGASLSFGVLGLLGPGAKNAGARAHYTTPGTWRTWLLTAGDELRAPPPPPVSPDERAEVLALQRQTTSTLLASI